MAHRKHGSHLLSSEDLDAILDTTDYSTPPPTDDRRQSSRPEADDAIHATYQPFASLKDLIKHAQH